MSGSRFIGIASLALALALKFACPARADGVGYALDRFEPAPAGDPFFVVEYPWYAAPRWFAGGLTLDIAHDPLVIRQFDARGILVTEAVISNELAGRVQLAGALSRRFGLSATIPVVFYESGSQVQDLRPTSGVAGDVRLGVHVPLVGRPDTAFALGAVAYVWIPTGSQAHLTGDGQVRLMPRITAGGLWNDRVRWAANTSLLLRRTAHLSNDFAPAGNTVGSEVQLSAGASYLALDHRFAIGLEATLGVSGGSSLAAGQDAATSELLAGAHYAIDDHLTAGIAASVALAGSPGPPEFRLVFSIAWAPGRNSRSTPERNDRNERNQVAAAPPPRDRDLDGVPDPVDACPDRPGVASPDPIRNGCPPASEKVVVLPDDDGHVGGVVVDDGTAKTLIDQPYAGAEIGSDGRALAIEAVPAKAAEHSIAAIATVLPPSDRDGDGIADSGDACPDRPGVGSPDPVRNGCPPAVEKVVVLPDLDGHVGGVEVSDGHTTTVLDQPYTSAEVATDGLHPVAPAPPGSVAKSIAAVAAALPILDSDRDGIRDEDDACPDVAGPASRDPIRNGCPATGEKVIVLPDADGHVGGVEVDDGQTRTLLDKPYATSVLGGDGRAHAAAPSKPHAVDRALAKLAKALPVPDRDSDGIPDNADACPDRPGSADPDPARNGCPQTAETVIVLPDENGNVGAVEVDDGQTKLLIDHAYDTAETGVDGVTRKAASNVDAVAQQFGPTMAAQPAGARIIIYFDNAAQPVRDLTGPVANVVAEVKGKATYTIDVIGHTDQTGSADINARLGRERAQLIADRLIAAGIPKDRIRVISKGASEPAVDVPGKNVAELRNRRVEVFVR